MVVYYGWDARGVDWAYSAMTTQDKWPDWITATAAVIGIIAAPVGLTMRRLFASVTRKEFKEYLEKRDTLGEQRHQENLGNFRAISEKLTDIHGRVSYIEGKMEQK